MWNIKLTLSNQLSSHRKICDEPDTVRSYYVVLIQVGLVSGEIKTGK